MVLPAGADRRPQFPRGIEAHSARECRAGSQRVAQSATVGARTVRGVRQVAERIGGRGVRGQGDFDRDGDVDILITTNQGPAYLYRNDVAPGQRSLRLKLVGTKSNRDAVGAVVRVSTPDGTQSRMVRTGSSYLSQSELALTFGLGRRDAALRVVMEWPSGRTQEFKDVRAGMYECVEGASLTPRP